MSDYKHEWINDDARYVVYNESGSVVESENNPTNSTVIGGKHWHLERVQAQEERTVYRRYTCQQRDLEARGWTLWNAGDGIPNLKNTLTVELLLCGDDGDIFKREKNTYPIHDVNWSTHSNLAAYRLSHADGYKDGVKVESNMTACCGNCSNEWTVAIGKEESEPCPRCGDNPMHPSKKLSVNDKPEWIGGVPPLGVVCEVWHGDEWIKCLVLGGDIYNNIAYQLATGEYKGEFNATPTEADFRPIQSERDKVIEKAISATDKILGAPSNSLVTKNSREVLETAYDLGFLSMPKGEE